VLWRFDVPITGTFGETNPDLRRKFIFETSGTNGLTDFPPQRSSRRNDHPNHTKIAENTHFSTMHNSTTLGLIALKIEIQNDVMLNNCFAI
jgi:hypothetical protein